MSARSRSFVHIVLTVVTIALMFTPPIGQTQAAGPWYVAPGGSDASDCESPATPCGTINGAIGKASAGDIVIVATGTYTNTVGEVVLINKSINLQGGWDAAFATQTGMSIIDGQAARRGITATSGAATVNRFIIRDSTTGVRTSGASAISFDDSLIEENAEEGIHAEGASVNLTDSAVRRNVGFGLYISSPTVTLERSQVERNGGTGIGGGYGTVFVNNSSVAHNKIHGIHISGRVIANNSTFSSNGGSGIFSIWSSTLYNSTIAYNGQNGLSGQNFTFTLTNTLVYGNGPAGVGPDCTGITSSGGYNLLGTTAGCSFTPTTGDQVNVEAQLSPLIGSPAYHPLLPTSPAINAANPAGCQGSSGSLTADQRGAPRDAACDIGAYEYTTPGPAAAVLTFSGENQRTLPLSPFPEPLTALVLDGLGSPVDGATVTFSAPASGASGTFADTGNNATTAVTDGGGLGVAAILTANGLLGGYLVEASVADVATPAVFDLSNGGWYVAPGGSDANDCESPATPCGTINGAIGKAGAGHTVYVAEGTYTGSGSEVGLVSKNTALSGGWDAAFTAQTGMSTIDGQAARRGITVTWVESVTIERFIVENGANNGDGGGISNSADSLTIADSIIRNNQASGWGGGVASLNGTLLLQRTIVMGNNVGGGGGGVSGGPATVLNESGVVGNVVNNDAPGGGIYAGGSLILNNSTVSGNRGALNGGGIAGGGTIQLYNSTVSGNSAKGSGGGLYRGTGPINLSNSIVAGNWTSGSGPDCSGMIGTDGYNLVGDTAGCGFTPGAGDLTDTDPRLGPLVNPLGYHALASDSPAVDAGNPVGCVGSAGPLLADQRGAARVGRCDIGAYEYMVPGPAVEVVAVGGTPQSTLPLYPFPALLQAVVLDSVGSPVPGISVDFSAPATGPSGTFAGTQTITASVTTDGVGQALAPAFTADVEAGTFSVTAAVAEPASSASFSLATNADWYVSTGGSDANDCISPAAACGTINGALGKPGFALGDTVLVASGFYTGSDGVVVTINKSAHIGGGYDATFTGLSGQTIIDGEVSRNGVFVDVFGVASSRNVTLQRLVVQSGQFGIVNSHGNLTLEQVLIRYNYVTGLSNNSGGSLGQLTVNNSAIIGNGISNTGGEGGGFQNLQNARAVLNNTTISGNSAGKGGGVFSSGTLNLNSITLVDNTAQIGGGLHRNLGQVRVNNSLVADNEATTGPDCYGTVTSQGHTLISDTDDCNFISGPGDLVNVHTPAGALLGTIPYYFLVPGHPAIDAGSPAGCRDHLGGLLRTDQRGTPRPLDFDDNGAAVCDIGAYEADPANPVHQTFLPLATVLGCLPYYADDYSEPDSGWPEIDLPSVRYQYLNGEYRILVKNANWFAGATPGVSATDFIASVSAHRATTVAGSYGLLFAISDDFSEYYVFEVDPDGAWRLHFRRGGSWGDLAWGNSSAIRGGTAANRLKVERHGFVMKIYANGQLLTTAFDRKLTGLRRIGVVATSYSQGNFDARFDDFAVYSANCDAAQVQSLVGAMSGAEALEMPITP